MQNILITGANRGIGFELTRQYAAHDDVHIFAACRTPARANDLSALAARYPSTVTVLPLDINDEASIDAAASLVKAKAGALDALINNAGINPKNAIHQSRDLGQLAAADVAEVVTTNAVSPLIVTQAFVDLLRMGSNPRVVMISSGMGSLQRAGGDAYAYRISKAAMNMGARVLALDSAMAGITTITVNPGWVKTDMGGPHAALMPEQSASGLRGLINSLTSDDNGKFYQYDGSELPW